MINSEVLFQVSLVAAYVAGVVALFAPCCISYLFPAYVANIFKEKSKILTMTLVYSLGIFVVLLPVVLGAKALSSFFLTAHDTTYKVAAVLMITMGLLSLLGWKLPMPHFSVKTNRGGRLDVGSTFILGVVAGITSACCAPVLIGVMTLSALTASLPQALLVGMMYVFGMVTPLLIGAMVVGKSQVLHIPWLKQKISTVSLFNKDYPIFVSNLIGSALFVITGLMMLWLTAAGKISMTNSAMQAGKSISDLALILTDRIKLVPGGNMIAAILLLGFITVLAVLIKKEHVANKEKPAQPLAQDQSHKTHHSGCCH